MGWARQRRRASATASRASPAAAVRRRAADVAMVMLVHGAQLRVRL